MQIFHQTQAWLAFRPSLDTAGSIGFVPTMGNLHSGHASLIEQSKQQTDKTVVSLFINPTQFNHQDDFTHYPRTLEADLALLEQLGVDYCLIPNEQDIYNDSFRYRVEETELCQIMEGAKRPGHFTGVLTVVLKLLNLVRPSLALFGEKDYQQYLLIRDMVKAFFLPIRIQSCPTIRESSGLAYSSRNNRLSPEERELAEAFARIFQQVGTTAEIVAALQERGIDVDYVLDYEGRRYAAVIIGAIRLIDNYPIALA